MTAPARARTSAERTEERDTQTIVRPRTGTESVRSRSATTERTRRDRSQRTGTESRPQSTSKRTAAQRSTTRRSATERGTVRASVQRARAQKAKLLQSKVATSRVPFIVSVMAVLACGLIATLWLAIAAVSGSYQLQKANAEANALQERKEALVREVSTMDSTPALQRRAKELGMVEPAEPAHLVVQPDGSVRVVGEPKAATAPAPPAPKPQTRPQPPAQHRIDNPQRLAATVPGVEAR